MRHIFFICFLLVHFIKIHGQSPGSNIFNYEGIHDIRLSFHQENFWDSLNIYKAEGELTDKYTYMVCTVDFDGLIIDSTGIRLKGNSSYWTPGLKKSIKLKFNKFVSGQKLDGLKKVNLNNNFNDPTSMREKLFLDMLQDNGVHAPRCAYARVYINDDYWGLYTMVDHIDKVFLLSHFNDKNGNLYKGDKEPWMPCANLTYKTDPSEYRNCYTLETNELLNDWSDLEDLIYVINNTSQPEYFSTLNTVLNAESFINAWATNIVFVNVDSYVETGHNYYIYHNPVTDRFEWITWDVNEAFGLWNVGMPLDQLYGLDILYMPPNPEFERPLSYFMLQDSTYRKMYTDKVYDLVSTEFTPDILYPKIDSLYDLIKNDVYLDSNKIISNSDFDMNIFDDVHIPDYPGWVPGLKSFIQERYNLLTAQLHELGYSETSIGDTSFSAINNSVYLYPNPAKDFIHLVTKAILIKNISIEIINADGQVLLRQKIRSNLEKISLTGYSKGIYFVRIISQNSVRIERLIKL